MHPRNLELEYREKNSKNICRGIVDWALFPYEGANIIDHKRAACLAPMRNVRHPSGWEWFFIRPGVGKDREKTIKFYDWLLNHSVWNDAFYTKDPEEFHCKGGFIYTDIPKSYAYQAGIISRYPHERPITVEVFLDFRKHIPDMYAWLFSTVFTKYKSEYQVGWYGNTNHIGYSLNHLVQKPECMYNMLNNNRKYFKEICTLRDNSKIHELGDHWLYPGLSDFVPWVSSRQFPVKFPETEKRAIIDDWGDRVTSSIIAKEDLPRFLDKMMELNNGK